jgi:hypothetical protein
LIRLVALRFCMKKPELEGAHRMFARGLVPILAAAAGLLAFTPVSPAVAGCWNWGCRPACAPAWFGPPVVVAPIPCGALVYPPQPVYRVEQGPIHNVVVVPYEPAAVRFDYLPPRFFADCACYR